MKIITTLFAVLFVSQIGRSQQLVQNINDMYRLKDYETIFIDKPLKDLLKEIKPEIKTANVFNEEGISLFLFKFTTLEQQRNRDGEVSDRLTLLVYVKEFIDWNFLIKPKGNEILWTLDDAQKYANFTIMHISVVQYRD